MKISYQQDFVGYFVEYNAPNKLFRKPEERKNLNDDQKQEWFSSFWRDGFAQTVQESEIITAEVARDQLGLTEIDSRSRFFKNDMQHRLTRYSDMSFIVQLDQLSSDEWQVNQIWFVSSRDFDPLKICVTFPSEESKKRFISLADGSDKYGNRLLEKLVRDYMREHGQSWH